MSLDQESARKVLDADLGNILRKVKAGKPLTVAERARLQASASGKQESQPYATSQSELARACGVDRRKISALMRESGFPKKDDAGRWNVGDVLEWMRKRGATPDEPGGIEDEKLRQLQIKNGILQLKYDTAKGLLLPRVDVDRSIRRNVVQAKSRILAAITTGCHEGGLKAILSPEQVAPVRAAVERRILEAMEELSTSDWGDVKCPGCGVGL